MKAIAALILIFMSIGVTAQSNKAVVMHTIDINEDSVRITFQNKEKVPVKCEGEYEISLIDLNTNDTLGFRKLVLSPYILKATSEPQAAVFKFSVKDHASHIEKMKSQAPITCSKDISELDKTNAMIGHILNGNIPGAEDIYSTVQNRENFKYIDLSGTDLDSEEVFDQAIVRFNLNHIDVDNTPLQNQILKESNERECKTRRHSRCGFKYFNKVSPNCPVMNYNSKANKKCGEIYNAKADLEICGCAKRKENSTSCWFGGCPCETPRTCVHPSFGIKEYKKCEMPEFGVKEYTSCRNEKHGIEDVKKCDLEITEDNNLKSCGIDEDFKEFFELIQD